MQTGNFHILNLSLIFGSKLHQIIQLSTCQKDFIKNNNHHFGATNALYPSY